MHGLNDLTTSAAELPDAWRSRVMAQIGGANLKVLRMDAAAYDEEVHPYDEALLVVDGVMELVVDGVPVTVDRGNIYVVPAGVPHAVAAGSRGTLVIIEPRE
jgi:mannose-6-phosphate isomerase-like protein (cupin superfamily)